MYLSDNTSSAEFGCRRKQHTFPAPVLPHAGSLRGVGSSGFLFEASRAKEANGEWQTPSIEVRMRDQCLATLASGLEKLKKLDKALGSSNCRSELRAFGLLFKMCG